MEKIINNRIRKIRESFSAYKIDTFMVHLEQNRRYLSGFTGDDLQFEESAGVLFINETKLILATDPRYILQAKREAPLYEIYCYKDFIKELPIVLDSLNTKKLGYESLRLSQYLFKKIEDQLGSKKLDIKLISTKNLVESFRLIKERNEIENTKKSIKIAESAFANISNFIKPGMTEKEAAWEIEKRMHEKGAESLSFPIVTACGESGAIPHYRPKVNKIKEGQPILFDWGAKFNGYCSDISRTIFLGKPDNTFNKIYTTVLDAHRKAIDEIKPGKSSKSIYEIALNHIENKGFNGKFSHGLGHGTGLAIHENPKLNASSDTSLKPGMLFTVEPGIYIEGWGGVRLENQVVVTEDGVEVLNNLDF
jgi:Xaa-Pro aminopeptidase